jgi:hypothetical protein
MVHKSAYYLAGVEFVLGTILLLCLLQYHTDFLAFAIIYLVIVSSVVNLILLIVLIVELFKDRKALLPIVVLLLNIPVAILYVYVANANISFE